MRIFAAKAAHGQGRQFLALFLQILLDLVLDWQTVAIPAGHIGRGLTLHIAGLDNDILEDFVHGRAHMDIAVGVWGAVMQHIGTL